MTFFKKFFKDIISKRDSEEDDSFEVSSSYHKEIQVEKPKKSLNGLLTAATIHLLHAMPCHDREAF